MQLINLLSVPRALVALAAASFISLSANAAVVYDNFGPGDSFIEGAGYTIDASHSQGVGFIAAATGRATSVDVGMGVVGTVRPKLVHFSLYADNGANNIGLLLEGFDVSVANAFGTEVVSSATLLGTTLLTAGSKYWLIAASVDGTSVPWNLSDNDLGDRWIDGSINPDSRELAAFRITATESTVAEPGELALLMAGLIAGALVRRRRRVGSHT